MANKIQFISYNILADYLNSPKYILVKEKYLDNNYRIKLLLKKLEKVIINNTNNTIICLQEVGPMQLSALFTFFTNYKYLCFYYKNLAIFYPNKYKIMSAETNHINTLAKKYLKKDRLIEKINNFNQVYMILQIQTEKNKIITICNTHIISNPRYNNTIKVLQCYLLARKLEKYKKVIFCGDFNSTPLSNVYKLLNTGQIKYPYYGDFTLPFKFASSYNTLYDNGGEKNITTHTTNILTPKFTETIDYIWTTPDITPIYSNKIIDIIFFML